jgi:hypothetical protein
VQATFYFKFYLFRALKQTQLGHLYLPQLGFWHRSIAEGKALKGSITLPPGISGRYVWAGNSQALRPGRNVVE